jgi:hypothetical protein
VDYRAFSDQIITEVKPRLLQINYNKINYYKEINIHFL